ncbi:phosphotransferase [Longimicrobium sp.]|uniref:phosphotransferase n=1 Tax=Longimicrobium sp. TaxID=2029185 RepID=UPI002E2F30FC|nr:phosphotransferase [Longimicrobium sp.]HEX6042633.1 phosphotransferase [Longimicrobium sp.]
MTEPWRAEREVTADLALSLVREQFPELGAGGIRPFGSGWDNTAFLVDGALVFRFPRKQSTVALLERETRVMPILAARLPLPVPDPRWAGRPMERYPWPFAGYRVLDGVPVDAANPTDLERRAAAGPLGAFLAALHATPADGLGLPGDEMGRTEFARRMPELEARLAHLQARGRIADAEPWLHLFDAPLPPFSPTPAVVHGDLYVRHLLVDEARRISGVIDWGDVHVGDPGLDLKVLYAFLPARARDIFLRAYGPVDARTLRMARLRAAFHCTALAWFAESTNDAPLLREALAGMRRALEPD